MSTGKTAIIEKWVFYLLSVCILIIIFDLGFNTSPQLAYFLQYFYLGVFLMADLVIVRRIFWDKSRNIRVRIVDIAILVMSGIAIWLLIVYFPVSMFVHPAVYVSLFLLFVRELSEYTIYYQRRYLNPAQLFIISFLLLIFLGTSLLMLPNATQNGISLTDALFTSTSAVCVTGLAVVDTGTYFTVLGQTIIVILIQLGGLGVMTFTSYFAYFFSGESSYENQLILQDMVNADKLGEVFGALRKIIFLTLGIEFVGGVLIFFDLPDGYFPSTGSKLFFAFFHTISSFCNAGFSTLPNSLYQEGFRYNYSLHLVVISLFVLGGIGFPILFNFMKYLRYQISNRLIPFSTNREVIYKPWVLNINTRIVLITTFLLLFVGTLLFYVLEYDNTLAEHNGFGKIVTAFFGAATPRTAGYNSVDTGALKPQTIMIVLFLMWVGASPASTGGGIKTSTLAVGTLNFFSVARGKDRVEVFRREISDMTIKRAFTAISLSLIVVGIATFFLVIFEPDKTLISLAFETFSAFGTVGLSMGITGKLSVASKLVLSVTMFIGRVSLLSIMIAVLRKVKNTQYRYPSESIVIN
ncbi:MAG: potassium transporter TrkG [Bacteroidia bacterium]|nr:potassium transporter TrkG [Bacteroidia bacterium]